MIIQKALLWAMFGAATVSACGSDTSSTSATEGVPEAGAGSAAQSSGGSVASVAGTASTAGGTSPRNGSGGEPSAGGSSAGGSSAGSSGMATQGDGGTSSGGEPSAACNGNATYKITVDVTWSGQGLDNPHYTTVIGGVHSGNVSLWKLGGLATEGIKEMAEMGATAPLAGEVNTAIGLQTAKAVIQFGGGPAPGKSTGTVELTPAFPQVSVGSMLAPTPDWFVGVSSLSLCDAGAWLTTKTVDAVVYDAGTKDGADFSYGFPETAPPVAIGYSIKFPNQTPAGTISFEKQ